MKMRRPYAEALASANRLVDELRPYCERIQIAGSLRRGMPVIGDIELVAIAGALEADLFGETTRTAVDWWVDSEQAAMGTEVTKNGPRYKQFIWFDEAVKLHVPVDLFLATERNWGYILMLRTGPWQFSRRMVTAKGRQGYLPREISVNGGLVKKAGRAVDVATEVELFELWGMEFIAPENRR